MTGHDPSGLAGKRRRGAMAVRSLVITGAMGLVLAGRVAWAVKPTRSSQTKDTAMSTVVKEENQFATDLYGRLKDKTLGNLFFSPYSVSTALAMTYAGATGETQKQMAEVLHFTVPEQELHQAMARLRENLLAGMEKGYQLRVANRLWGQQGYGFLPEFLQTTRKFYGAELGVVDFAQKTEATRQEINQWVEKQTEEKIKDLLAPGVLDPQTRLVLTNAIYFKGNWQEKFEKEATRDAPFHLSADNEITVPMMHQTDRFGYKAIEGLQVLEMPYAKGELSMVVLLPKEIEGLSELEKKLTPGNLQAWTEGFRRQKVIVYVPRFKMTSQFGLKDTLQALGMTVAFDAGKADFSRISRGEGLCISAVVHKAFVDVNEEGTEAAAATGVVMRATAARFQPEEPPTFRADHPFLFLIRDNQTGAILFMGRVANPKG
jgi:serpin B